MELTDVKRISRLTAIVTQLQTKRLLTANYLSENFNVSIRTIYRDIKTLQHAGVPILSEDGKGYTLMEGYKIPPIMFTESEANALVTAERLILKSGDTLLVKEYMSAIVKIKAILKYSTKEKVDLLSKRIAISPTLYGSNSNGLLTIIQDALTAFKVLEITYHSEHKDEKTKRLVEPFGLYFSLQESWLLIAYCRLRKDFRMFRLDRIKTLILLELSFEPHVLNLADYLKEKEKNFNTPDMPLS